jgi:hypothetical protein
MSSPLNMMFLFRLNLRIQYADQSSGVRSPFNIRVSSRECWHFKLLLKSLLNNGISQYCQLGELKAGMLIL